MRGYFCLQKSIKWNKMVYKWDEVVNFKKCLSNKKLTVKGKDIEFTKGIVRKVLQTQIASWKF